MSASKPQGSVEVRIKHSLNKNEEEFVAKRRNYIQQSLNKLKICCSKNEVPNIALLGSGGGERAMVGLLGSLDQLRKTGLLDCILYLSGVSGSTWCMASLYQEPDWSTQLETVKDKIIQRLSGPKVSYKDAFDKLKKYYYGKDIFSLTDVWAAMFVTSCVKEIDEHTLTDQRNKHNKDPFPIYTVIDKQCKQHKDADPWFEFTPHEAGYSLIGAFVETSSFGSKFDNGCKKKHQPEIDMLYLQALCGSALAERNETCTFLWKRIQDLMPKCLRTKEMTMCMEMGKVGFSEDPEDPHSPPIDECLQVLMDLVDMNLSVLNGIDPSDLDESIRTKLNELTGGKHFQKKKLNLADKEADEQYMEQYTVDVCNALSHYFSFKQDKKLTEGKHQLVFQEQTLNLTDKEAEIQYTCTVEAYNGLSHCFSIWPLDLYVSICKCIAQWKWGTNYGFLHNMTDKAVPSTLLERETRDYEDAGLLLNSPYFSVLRKERDIDLIISLDFSEGDPFTTVREAAETCGKLNIPFPEVNIPKEDVKKPKDFYVFKGQDAPTVIHIPLFNQVNCGDDIEAWRIRYKTFQLPYSAEMITELMDVAGKNITNNKDNLKEQIRLAIKKHK